MILDVCEHWWAPKHKSKPHSKPFVAPIVHYSFLFFLMIVENMWDRCHRTPPVPRNSSRFWSENKCALTLSCHLFWAIYRLRPKGSWTKDMLRILGQMQWFSHVDSSLAWTMNRGIPSSLTKSAECYKIDSDVNSMIRSAKFQTPQTALNSLISLLEICSTGSCPCRAFSAAPQDARGVQLRHSVTQGYQNGHKRRANARNP
jgi:hypothetical protein